MEFKSHKKIYLGLGVLALLGVAGWFFLGWLKTYQQTTYVTFLNVGQGDAILISEGSNQILIDGGRNGQELLSKIGRQIPFWDRTIEVVIATHPDADHIGGFPGLFAAYQVKTFLSTGAQGDTETAERLQAALKENADNESATDTRQIFRGSSLRFPGGGELVIEYPPAPSGAPTAAANQDTNQESIVARFTFEETQMLLTGDLGREEAVLPATAPADILKVAHHGSRSSTSDAFLDLVQPKEAVFSVGKNSYGHPSAEVLTRLSDRGIVLWRTDRDGDVRYRCTREAQRCEKESQ